MTADAFHISVSGRNYGPASREELARWVQAGSFSAGDFVWDAAGQAWVEAASFPPLKSLFVVSPPPATEAAVEATPSFEGAAAGQAVDLSGLYCANHEDEPMVATCPRCGKSYCAACLGEADGMTVCLDCLAASLSRNPGAWRRYLVPGVSVLAIAAGVVGSPLLFSRQPAAQPKEPPVIKLERNAAPVAPDTSLAPPAAAPDPIITYTNTPTPGTAPPGAAPR